MGVVIPLAAALGVGFLTIAVKVAVAGERHCTKRITPEIVRLAKKWADRRGLPVEWVVATIKIESGGKSCLVGDQGRSVGLMQVNAEAHGGLLKSMGLSRSSLFRPEANIAVGSALLRQRWQEVHAATEGRSEVPMATLVALAYWGPGPTLRALRAGRDPRDENPRRVARWNAALSATAPLV